MTFEGIATVTMDYEAPPELVRQLLRAAAEVGYSDLRFVVARPGTDEEPPSYGTVTAWPSPR